jgi:hypothetical protein
MMASIARFIIDEAETESQRVEGRGGSALGVEIVASDL